MTKEEWFSKVAPLYEAAGFAVGNYDGWPLVEKPKEFAKTFQLLDFRPEGLSVSLHIYMQGALILPGETTELLRTGIGEIEISKLRSDLSKRPVNG